jgi:dihydrofolate reductase
MGKIVSNFFISLDGVVESPDKWHVPYGNDQMWAKIGEGMQTYKAFLMGRQLYEEWSDFWPKQGDDVPFAPFINNVPKYVVSNSLDESNWNNTTIVSGDVAKELRAIKDRSGDIGMSGSATVARWLLAHDLLDELGLMVHPIVVGRGKKLFEESQTVPLQLKNHEAFETGVMYLSYVPAPS